MTDVPRRGARLRSLRLRTQLLLVINSVLVLLMLVFVGADYRLTMHSRLRDKEIALSDEARTLTSALLALESGGSEAIQRYVDSTCDLMNAGESPGHRITVQIENARYVSHPTGHEHAHGLDPGEEVLGAFSSAAIRAQVSERRSPIVMSARRAALGRIGAIGFGAIVAAAVLNGLLLRLVSRPLERTVGAIREIGRGRVGTIIGPSTNRELSELADEVSSMSLELARREADRRAQLDRARRLQTHLLPDASANAIPGVAIEYHPADEIAGDYVDVIRLPNGDTVLCIADVVGHGVHAAMGSAAIKALVLSQDLGSLTPAALLESVNSRFLEISLPEDFASMAVIRVAADHSSAQYASAGHEPALVIRSSGACETLSSTGLILGIDPAARFEQVEIDLRAGDRLVLMSDGVTESSNSQSEQLGRAAVTAAIRASGFGDAARLAATIIQEVERHRGEALARDDSTVLVFAAQPSPVERRPAPCVI